MTKVEDIESATMAELDEIAWKHRYNMNRDKLAAMAMQGLCAGGPAFPRSDDIRDIARISYNIAEAMLDECKKRRGGQ